MNDDIVARLRPAITDRWVDHALIETPGKTLNDAADEIERLRGAVTALADALTAAGQYIHNESVSS